MSSRNKLSPELQQQIRERAKFLCEYCHASEKWQYVQFTIDHIIPIRQADLAIGRHPPLQDAILKESLP
ncbi:MULTISPECIES: HNH endonuclease [Leptolyngbya]|uniref:HNH endonuclease n=1 Tax=Leptolyngbya TaxID=47251 RepID=UPI0016892CD3|nr:MULTISPECIES: HNH endonuclease [unclassified Leptolyngbya]MBD1854067.1 HNH endonuclease [Leptolyngbya sp. FACHB-1624]MCY6490978.1 HNH endonuclease [Leptolyngbya sp. GGD]